MRPLTLPIVCAEDEFDSDAAREISGARPPIMNSFHERTTWMGASGERSIQFHAVRTAAALPRWQHWRILRVRCADRCHVAGTSA